MPIAETEVRWIQPYRMNLWDMLYVPAVIQGVQTTVRHMVNTLAGQGVTQQFPEERPKLPPHYRGVHRLNRDEDGRVKCVACYLCSTACPAHCIDIVAAPSPWPDREKYPETFVIDELRCIYCGMCEEACPVDAIELTTLFDLTGMSRQEMMFDKEKLLSVFDRTVATGTDPVRTHRGRLGPSSEVQASGGLLGGTTDESGRSGPRVD